MAAAAGIDARGTATAVVLRHLPSFIAVAETGSLFAAADRLNIAQSAVSRRIRLLEETLGVSLFAREARGMRLLPAGEALLDEARGIVEAAARAGERVRAIAAGTGGRLTVGFAEIVARASPMLALLNEFAAAEGIQVQLRPLVSEEQRTELTAGTIDLGILYHAPDEPIAQALATPRRRFAARPLLTDRYGIAIHRDHPLAHAATLHLADLGQEPIVWASHKKNPRLYERLLAACEAREYAPRIVMETPTSDVTMAVVGRGMGIGFVPQSLAAHFPAEVVFVSPVDFDMAMRLSVVWRTHPDGDLATRLASELSIKLHAAGE